nr:MAG TPA: hypothetical protein [Caudoviricetes sp.]DAP17976.1 MAG TPA: hypothetical protein [Bacteriophage sp.]
MKRILNTPPIVFLSSPSILFLFQCLPPNLHDTRVQLPPSAPLKFKKYERKEALLYDQEGIY